MTDAPDPRKPVQDDKAARRAAALRANLGRRKAQKRARGAEDKAAEETAEQDR